MAIFDGKELTFEQSDWFIINFFRMLWRYGLSFLRMQMWVESVLDKFMRSELIKISCFLNQIHEFKETFHWNDFEMLLLTGSTSTSSMVTPSPLWRGCCMRWAAMVFCPWWIRPWRKACWGRDFHRSSSMISLLPSLASTMARVYASMPLWVSAWNHLWGFLRMKFWVIVVCICGCVGAVSLAGADSGLWAVDGGNKRVCSGLLYHSKSDVISARVTSVSVKLRPSKTGSCLIPLLWWLMCEDFGSFLWNFFVFRHHDQFLWGELCWRVRPSTRAVRRSSDSSAASPGKVWHRLLWLHPSNPIAFPRPLPPNRLHPDPRHGEHVLPGERGASLWIHRVWHPHNGLKGLRHQQSELPGSRSHSSGLQTATCQRAQGLEGVFPSAPFPGAAPGHVHLMGFCVGDAVAGLSLLPLTAPQGPAFYTARPNVLPQRGGVGGQRDRDERHCCKERGPAGTPSLASGGR